MTDNTEKHPFKPFIPLLGKVAAVLNERELVINIGKKSGVEIGMKFKVLTEKPAEILDPDTQDILGIVDREKVRVEVVEIQEKLSVCRTYKTFVIEGGSMAAIYNLNLKSIFSPRRELPETLKAEDSAFPKPISEEESFVKKGDRVLQILDEK